MFVPRLELVVPGQAVPNKSAQIGRGRAWKEARCAAYQRLVYVSWHQAGRQKVDCSNGIIVSYRRYVRRPKAHYRRDGTVKDNAPDYPITRASGDVDNLFKLAIDALNGHAWHDDARVFGHRHNTKVFADDGLGERVEIVAEPAPPLDVWLDEIGPSLLAKLT